MTRMTGPDCAVIMCNLIFIHTYIHHQCEWHRMTRMTGPDCAVMCNLINIHTYTLCSSCVWSGYYLAEKLDTVVYSVTSDDAVCGVVCSVVVDMSGS